MGDCVKCCGDVQEDEDANEASIGGYKEIIGYFDEGSLCAVVEQHGDVEEQPLEEVVEQPLEQPLEQHGDGDQWFVVYTNICAGIGQEVPRSKCLSPPKVAEKDESMILWNFQIRTNRMVMANQSDIVMVDKQQKKAVVIDAAIPSDSTIRKKEHVELRKYQGLKEELEKMW